MNCINSEKKNGKMKLKFKDNRLKRQLAELTPKCLFLLSFFNLFSFEEFNKTAYITSLIRKSDKTSVHAFGRGVDIRSSIYTEDQKNKLLQFFDDFPYDSKRPKMKTLILHGEAEHFHLQTLT